MIHGIGFYIRFLTWIIMYTEEQKQAVSDRKGGIKMNNEKRVTEVLSQIAAFSKDSYTKSEFLPELLKLQKELIDLTFNAEHAENGDLRLWDVERHLRKMNEERGHIADDELAKFIKGSKAVSSTISAEFSSNAGEQKVFRALENLACENAVLHNVELEFDGRRTEIDAIVFTNRAIFIIEIKNSKKDIFIDQDGEYYRTGHSMHHGCNIAEKMDEREALLRKALERAGMEYLKIFKIVTFTNPRIDVENKYHYIKVCGSNYLPTFIEKFTSNQWYTYENICIMMAAVNEVKCPEAYQRSINMDEYKSDFANLMAILESAEEAMDEPENISYSAEKNIEPEIKAEKAVRITHNHSKGMVAAAIGVTLINAALFISGRLLRK